MILRGKILAIKENVARYRGMGGGGGKEGI